jgi:hypothetical protein
VEMENALGLLKEVCEEHGAKCYLVAYDTISQHWRRRQKLRTTAPLCQFAQNAATSLFTQRQVICIAVIGYVCMWKRANQHNSAERWLQLTPSPTAPRLDLGCIFRTRKFLTTVSPGQAVPRPNKIQCCRNQHTPALAQQTGLAADRTPYIQNR